MAAVQSVVARVAIDASGLNVDQEVDLEAIDETGAPVPGVEIDPAARPCAHRGGAGAGLRHPARGAQCSCGAPADGYRVTSVEAAPQTLTVSGEAAAGGADFVDLDRAARHHGQQRQPGGDRRRGAARRGQLVGDEEIRLLVTIEPDDGSRTWQVGVRLEGARASRRYRVDAHRAGHPGRSATDPRLARPVYHRRACRGGPAGSRYARGGCRRGADRRAGAGFGLARGGRGSRSPRPSRHRPAQPRSSAP